MGKTLTLVVVLISCRLVLAGQCPCDEVTCPSLETKYAESEAVFLAEVVSLKREEGWEDSIWPLHKMALNVVEIYKGTPAGSEFAYARHAPLDADYRLSIDIRISPGTRYIIFKRPETEVQLSLCTTFYEPVHERVTSFLQSKANVERNN